MSDAPALAGLKVVDLTRILAGPFCTQLLADHGASVIKVEPPGGDDTRAWGPPFRGDRSGYFDGLNRGKRGIAVDLGREAGRAVLLRLLDGADVLIENFKPGQMERMGAGLRTGAGGALPGSRLYADYGLRRYGAAGGNAGVRRGGADDERRRESERRRRRPALPFGRAGERSRGGALRGGGAGDGRCSSAPVRAAARRWRSRCSTLR